MIIKSIKLENFRNYESLDLDFEKGTNILYGDNAQGKTNVLEAIYLSATTKSHKGSKDKEIINFEKEEAHIRTILDKEGMEYRVDMHLRKNKSKGIAINGQPIKKAADLIGLLNVVFFSPEDLSIIKNELDSAEGIIQDYLTFSKPVVESVEELDIQEELTHILKLLRPLANYHSVKVSTDFTTYGTIQGDKSKFHQCFINIMRIVVILRRKNAMQRRFILRSLICQLIYRMMS